jgi:spiro-SPASM protein
LSAGLPDVIAAFAGPGEPLLHPGCLDMTEYAAKESGLSSFILETDGHLFDAAAAERVSALPPSRCQVIFRVDAVRPATYAALHPGTDLAAVTANIERFLSLREENRFRSFVQFVKYRENLLEMEEFWKFWEARKMPVIIQKSNDYAGQVKLEKVSDLTPIDRTVCWHIRRDLSVLSDGRVPVCKQDWDGRSSVADLSVKSVGEAWNLLEPYHLENASGGWTKSGCLNPLCAACDEWYAFNF